MPVNGMFICSVCGRPFTSDSVQPVESRHINSFSCGVSVADWLIRDMGLIQRSIPWLSQHLSVRRYMPSWLKKVSGMPDLEMTGVLPWTLASVLRQLGAEASVQFRVLEGLRPPADDERLAIALVLPSGIPHWVGARMYNGSVYVADNIAMISPLHAVRWDDIVEDRRPQAVLRVWRASPV